MDSPTKKGFATEDNIYGGRNLPNNDEHHSITVASGPRDDDNAAKDNIYGEGDLPNNDDPGLEADARAG